MTREICDICKEEVELKDVRGFFPEDSSYICKKCFGCCREGRDRKNETEYNTKYSLERVSSSYSLFD